MSNRFQDTARRVLRVEADAVAALIPTVGAAFDAACQRLLDSPGRVIVTGMGKSGHIGSKVAATLASTGTPAFFVHPAEASHGDLGMITSGDVVLAFSNSGETAEVLAILPVLKRRGIALVSITGKPQSTLAVQADVHLEVAVEEEACPHNLAPTSSTTAALAMGDALAIALLEARRFSPEDFALSHPGGSLGRRLLLTVDDLMHSGDDMPLVTEDTVLTDALMEISRKGLGMTAVVDADGLLSGIFTDGDLRRVLDQPLSDLRQLRIDAVMVRNPVVIHSGRLAAEALKVMDERKINGLIVVDAERRPIGALNMHNLFKAGVA
ncbi:KpsF/GutQ family sugar-phosphate isomerase [Isoalcanivorax beigongshangi]|uniref:Arabinose 5-phosphate isomerase n=1 Tax=Isoalcanivorax beigongshangi TaxID=3238810 RepID=A0ABV4AJC9_9GAMM